MLDRQKCYRACFADMWPEASVREHAFHRHVREQVLQSMLFGDMRGSKC